MFEKGSKPNYVANVVKKLKSFLAVAVERGLTSKMDFRFRSFTVKQEEVETVYLNDSEVAHLAAIDLSNDPTLDRVRDLFLIGCYTGLRFSDYSALFPANFVTREGVQLWTIVMQKARRRVYGPVTPGLVAILEKRGGHPPKGYANQVLNRYLKSLCQRAGFTQGVTVVSFRKGMRVETEVPKLTLITSHTARRSFATNEYLRAVSEGRSYRPIMEITGHRTEKTFFRYVKVTAEQNAVILAKGRAG